MSDNTPTPLHYYQYGSEEGERILNHKIQWFMAHGDPYHCALEFALIETYGPIDDVMTEEEHRRLLALDPPL